MNRRLPNGASGSRGARALALLVASVALLLSGTARAAPGAQLFSCADQGTIQIEPGLSNTPQTVHFTLELTFTQPCVSSDPTIHGGTATAEATGPANSCLTPNEFAGTATFHWDNGNVSEMRWMGAAAGLAGEGVGLIVGGDEFVGASFSGLVAFMPPDLTACSGAGITDLTFVGNDTLVGPTS